MLLLKPYQAWTNSGCQGGMTPTISDKDTYYFSIILLEYDPTKTKVKYFFFSFN
jgi:hypothetical protein